MTTFDGLNNNTDLIVGICPMLEFYNDPPPELFHSNYENGIKKIYQVEEKMNVFIQSPAYRGYFPNTSGRVVKVHTIEELETWTEKLQSKPTLLEVHCRRVARSMPHQSEQVVRDGYFAVILNPNNPHVKGLIETALDGARSAFKAEKRFILEIDVRTIVKDWFTEKVKESVKCEYGRMTVANTYVYDDIQSMFCCRQYTEKDLCCGCFIWPSSVYAIHRLLCRNFNVEISGRISEFTLRIHMDEILADSTKSKSQSVKVDNGKHVKLNRDLSIEASPVQSVSLCVPTSNSKEEENKEIVKKEIAESTKSDENSVADNPHLYEVTHETTADNVKLVVYNV